MKTDDLISMLATGAGAISAPAPARRYTGAIAWGAAGATLGAQTPDALRLRMAEVDLEQAGLRKPG